MTSNNKKIIQISGMHCASCALNIEKNLNNQLNAATKEFLIDSTKNIIKENKSVLSKIFLWFGKDFGSKKMIKEFISEYSGVKLNKFKIDYLPYNWDLNE